MTDINDLHDAVARMVDRAYEAGQYPPDREQIAESRAVMAAVMAAYQGEGATDAIR